MKNANSTVAEFDITTPATEAARQWQGWGTALKPALEPITLARKPLVGTVAANVMRHGTGALNIDASRVDGESTIREKTAGRGQFPHEDDAWQPKAVTVGSDMGRWPANLIHDGSAEVLARFPLSDGQQFDVTGTEPSRLTNGIYGEFANRPAAPARNDTGSAARFFYVAKASSEDRNEGCHNLQQILAMRYGEKAQGPLPQQTPSKPVLQSNHHPTVKPTDLMRYLLRLVTPPHGVALDPFLGSGSTGKAAMLEDFKFIGIERDPDYFAIAVARLQHATAQSSLFAA
jgi:site-specific DNA-methyltransferase (adenine-specific)